MGMYTHVCMYALCVHTNIHIVHIHSYSIYTTYTTTITILLHVSTSLYLSNTFKSMNNMDTSNSNPTP